MFYLYELKEVEIAGNSLVVLCKLDESDDLLKLQKIARESKLELVIHKNSTN